ncbi:UNVERIFIED_CONTAM: hypothetical protein H355_008211 [Colinus virginianus]|nr:hypothetical protein H355_008211 [Colinus virginianus]
MPRTASAALPALLLLLLLLGGPAASRCPVPCRCAGHLIACSRLEPSRLPERLPRGAVQLDLSHNKLSSIKANFLDHLHNLREVKLNNNELEIIPNLGPVSANLTLLSFVFMVVSRGSSRGLEEFEKNVQVANRSRMTPRELNLKIKLRFVRWTSNKIANILSEHLKPFQSLETLDLSNNNISELKMSSFPFLQLKYLYINSNRITSMEPGTFDNLSTTLQVLKLNRNKISAIPQKMFKLSHLQHLELNRNKIKKIDGLTFQGLPALKSLKLQRNGITRLMDGAFWGLTNMEVLDLTFNHLARLDDSSFVGLSVLVGLYIGNNKVNYIADCAFRGLSSLQTLDLKNNEISWTIEDMNGAFSGLDKLRKLDLSNNAIMSVQGNAFSQMKKLKEFDKSDDFPKPQITVQPETQSAIKGSNLSFVCSAASSSDSPMTFAWKKDNELLHDAEMENYAHLRAQGGEVMEYTTILRLRNVEFSSEGKYQCVISNHFGSSYSVKAKLTVNMLPSFTKIPMDLTIRAGAMARLECAAVGHPVPQIAWQKDGGTDFPAARKRRMHVMPEDDVFFIVDVKIEDTGVYSCTAQNTAGSISANATLTVLETPSFLRPLLDRTVTKGETAVLQCIAGGSPPPRLNWTKDDSPLMVTERHFFAASNQLLIIVDTDVEDAGKYTCEMSNTLGTERGNIRLNVIPTPTCDSPQNIAPALDDDGWATVGIVIIAVVCCVVGTSLVWVVIIYHTRRRNEDCSITNTDETNLPADIPSYLSSQGTLAERQDGYGSSENGSHHQFLTSSVGGYFLQQRDSNDNSSETDLEGVADPFLCHYLGTSGTMYLKGNTYSSETFDACSTNCNPDQRAANLDPYESGYLKKKECCQYSPPLEDPFDQCIGIIGMQATSSRLINSIYTQNEGTGLKSRSLNSDKLDLNRSLEPSSIISNSTFMGTFGKPVWRPQLDPLSSRRQPASCQPKISHNNPHSSLDFDPEADEDGRERTVSREENSSYNYEQSFENFRTFTFQSCDLDT